MGRSPLDAVAVGGVLLTLVFSGGELLVGPNRNLPLGIALLVGGALCFVLLCAYIGRLAKPSRDDN
jgi:drug/metabolite transporter (DMT)-like permease